MSEQNEEMINIWVLVGMILCLYGAIVTACGIYYSSAGVPITVMNETNPSLWWGIVILISGILMVVGGKKGKSVMAEAKDLIDDPYPGEIQNPAEE